MRPSEYARAQPVQAVVFTSVALKDGARPA